MVPFDTLGYLYTCADNISYNESGTVTAVDGTHDIGKTNADVQALRLYSTNMSQFPTNIETFFPNIRALNFGENLISEVKNSHLSPLQHLQYLSLWKNRITSLDSNLFAGIDSIQYIDFQFNRIMHVGHDFVLPNTTQRISFFDNPCINDTISNQSDVGHLKFQLSVKCPPTILQIENSLETRTNLLTNVNDELHRVMDTHLQFEKEIKYLLSTVAKLEAIIDRIDTKNMKARRRRKS